MNIFFHSDKSKDKKTSSKKKRHCNNSPSRRLATHKNVEHKTGLAMFREDSYSRPPQSVYKELRNLAPKGRHGFQPQSCEYKDLRFCQKKSPFRVKSDSKGSYQSTYSFGNVIDDSRHKNPRKTLTKTSRTAKPKVSSPRKVKFNFRRAKSPTISKHITAKSPINKKKKHSPLERLIDTGMTQKERKIRTTKETLSTLLNNSYQFEFNNVGSLQRLKQKGVSKQHCIHINKNMGGGFGGQYRLKKKKVCKKKSKTPDNKQIYEPCTLPDRVPNSGVVYDRFHYVQSETDFQSQDSLFQRSSAHQIKEAKGLKKEENIVLNSLFGHGAFRTYANTKDKINLDMNNRTDTNMNQALTQTDQLIFMPDERFTFEKNVQSQGKETIEPMAIDSSLTKISSQSGCEFDSCNTIRRHDLLNKWQYRPTPKWPYIWGSNEWFQRNIIPTAEKDISLKQEYTTLDDNSKEATYRSKESNLDWAQLEKDSKILLSSCTDTSMDVDERSSYETSNTSTALNYSSSLGEKYAPWWAQETVCLEKKISNNDLLENVSCPFHEDFQVSALTNDVLESSTVLCDPLPVDNSWSGSGSRNHNSFNSNDTSNSFNIDVVGQNINNLYDRFQPRSVPSLPLVGSLTEANLKNVVQENKQQQSTFFVDFSSMNDNSNKIGLQSKRNERILRRPQLEENICPSLVTAKTVENNENMHRIKKWKIRHEPYKCPKRRQWLKRGHNNRPKDCNDNVEKWLNFNSMASFPTTKNSGFENNAHGVNYRIRCSRVLKNINKEGWSNSDKLSHYKRGKEIRCENQASNRERIPKNKNNCSPVRSGPNDSKTSDEDMQKKIVQAQILATGITNSIGFDTLLEKSYTTCSYETFDKTYSIEAAASSNLLKQNNLSPNWSLGTPTVGRKQLDVNMMYATSKCSPVMSPRNRKQDKRNEDKSNDDNERVFLRGGCTLTVGEKTSQIMKQIENPITLTDCGVQTSPFEVVNAAVQTSFIWNNLKSDTKRPKAKHLKHCMSRTRGKAGDWNKFMCKVKSGFSSESQSIESVDTIEIGVQTLTSVNEFQNDSFQNDSSIRNMASSELKQKESLPPTLLPPPINISSVNNEHEKDKKVFDNFISNRITQSKFSTFRQQTSSDNTYSSKITNSSSTAVECLPYKARCPDIFVTKSGSRNSCYARPEWSNAKIEEIDRRVERALKLRQELRRSRSGIKSPSLISERNPHLPNGSGCSPDISFTTESTNNGQFKGQDSSEIEKDNCRSREPETLDIKSAKDMALDSQQSTLSHKNEVADNDPHPNNTENSLIKYRSQSYSPARNKTSESSMSVSNSDSNTTKRRSSSFSIGDSSADERDRSKDITNQHDTGLKRSGVHEKNSPPTKISRKDNAYTECPKLIAELVNTLPQVPLASFVEWFIETSNPDNVTVIPSSPVPTESLAEEKNSNVTCITGSSTVTNNRKPRIRDRQERMKLTNIASTKKSPMIYKAGPNKLSTDEGASENAWEGGPNNSRLRHSAALRPTLNNTGKMANNKVDKRPSRPLPTINKTKNESANVKRTVIALRKSADVSGIITKFSCHD